MLFLPDSGLLAMLLDCSAEKLLALPGLPRHLVETWVACELLKHLAFSTGGARLWHYRTHIEVGFVLEDRLGRLTGIEFKASASIDASDFKGLRHMEATEAAAFRCGSFMPAARSSRSPNV